MQGEQVVLTDMLQCRERRAQIQDTFIEQYHCPVISFCMNIPGPVKTNEQIHTALDGQKLSRPSYRKCIICGCQAQECARTRKHTVEEMQAKIEEMLSAE